MGTDSDRLRDDYRLGGGGGGAAGAVGGGGTAGAAPEPAGPAAEGPPAGRASGLAGVDAVFPLSPPHPSTTLNMAAATVKQSNFFIMGSLTR
ncbi:MAG: hypothetical protein U0939_00870 [Pirellulales bacterium]